MGLGGLLIIDWHRGVKNWMPFQFAGFWVHALLFGRRKQQRSASNTAVVYIRNESELSLVVQSRVAEGNPKLFEASDNSDSRNVRPYPYQAPHKSLVRIFIDGFITCVG